MAAGERGSGGSVVPAGLLRGRLGRDVAHSSSSAVAHTSGKGGRKHWGFDPFTAALDKVRRDSAATPRCARSLSLLRAAIDGPSAHKKSSNCSRAPRPAPAALAPLLFLRPAPCPLLNPSPSMASGEGAPA
jgi:hypothetical protein